MALAGTPNTSTVCITQYIMFKSMHSNVENTVLKFVHVWPHVMHTHICMIHLI
jgi:hypothetical protein